MALVQPRPRRQLGERFRPQGDLEVIPGEAGAGLHQQVTPRMTKIVSAITASPAPEIAPKWCPHRVYRFVGWKTCPSGRR